MGSVVCDNLLKFKSIKLERNFHTKPPCIMSQILSLELRTFPVSFNSHKHWLLGNCLRTLMSTSIPFIALFYYLNSWFQKCNLLLHLSLINIQKKSCCIQYTQPFISYFPEKPKQKKPYYSFIYTSQRKTVHYNAENINTVIDVTQIIYFILLTFLKNKKEEGDKKKSFWKTLTVKI